MLYAKLNLLEAELMTRQRCLSDQLAAAIFFSSSCVSQAAN
jgi:hypothetical protein